MEHYSLLLLSCIIAATISSYNNELTVSTHPKSGYVVDQYIKLFCDGVYRYNNIHSIAWRKDGASIAFYVVKTNTFLNILDSEIKVEFIKDRTNTIIIKDATLKESGNYSCDIYIGESDKPIKSKPKEIIVKKNADIGNMNVKIITKGKNWFEENIILAGELLEFICMHKMENSEVESIIWMKDGISFIKYDSKNEVYQTMDNVDGVEINLQKSEYGAIYLDKVTQETTGNFKCMVKGSKVTYSGSRLVVINKDPVTSGVGTSLYPAFKKKNAQESQHFEMECFLGYNENEKLNQVLWFKDNVLFYRYDMGKNETSLLFTNGLGNLRMVSKRRIKIDYLSPKCTGSYRCELIFEVTGEQKKKYHLEGNLKYLSKVGVKDLKVDPYHDPSITVFSIPE